jgi:hypothetical protein
MTDAPAAPSGETCPVCGKELVTGTIDLSETPDETSDVDLPRKELDPGRMVQVMACPDPDCPGPDTGAQL